MMKGVLAQHERTAGQQTGRSMLSSTEYHTIGEFLEARAGIRLGVGKEYLVSSRLKHVLETHGLSDMASLIARLNQGDRQLAGSVIEAMTTNETFWFRDPAHYRALVEHILPKLPAGEARIWSAAASTGQEAYSIAISIQDAREAHKLPVGMRYRILGTDISANALAEARAGVYCGVQAARGLSAEQQKHYFETEGQCVRVRDRYRAQIEFREYNLLQPFVSFGKFDVIFCRNVLIYFSQERKRDIVERFAQCLNPGGYLLLSSTESLSDANDLYEMESLAGGLAYRRR